MKLPLAALLTAATLLAACAGHSPDAEESLGRISYFDRDGDGRVDLEKHTYPGTADRDWQLLDEDHDGRYEKRILFGFAVVESRVDLPVPAGEKLSKVR